MTPERIEELADACYGDRSNEVSQSSIERAIRIAINEALEEAAQIFEKDDSQRWGWTADLPVISAAIRALKK